MENIKKVLEDNLKNGLDYFMIGLCIIAFCWLMIMEHEFEHALTWMFLLMWVFIANCREQEIKALKELCNENNIDWKKKLKEVQ